MAKLFGTSGIRGIFGEEVTLELGTDVGLALGTETTGKVMIARDTRTSSLALENSIVAGLESTGTQVLRAGLVPTPVLAHAARKRKATGVVVTASHNPPEYNGIKLWNSSSLAYTPLQEAKIKKLIQSKKFRKVGWKSIGHSEEVDIVQDYIRDVKKAVKVSKKFKIVLDCGNGAASSISPVLLQNYSSKLTIINPEPQLGKGRNSEPSSENITRLKAEVKKQKADIGIAHDGDADRLAVIDEKGRFVDKDKLLALLVKHEPTGKVVVPIDTSKVVEDVAKGSVIMSKVGDVHVAQKMKSSKAVFGGEPSGSFIFPKFSWCPDGILASLKVLEILSKGKKLSTLVDELPKYHTVRKTIKCKNSEKAQMVQKYSKKLSKFKGKTSKIDGTRLDLKDSWILVRASGTEPKIRITVETKTRKKADELLTIMLKPV